MASSPPLRHRVQVRENSLVRQGNENKKRRVGAHILSGHQKHENVAANLVDAAGSSMDVMEPKGASLLRPFWFVATSWIGASHLINTLKLQPTGLMWPHSC